LQLSYNKEYLIETEIISDKPTVASVSPDEKRQNAKKRKATSVDLNEDKANEGIETGAFDSIDDEVVDNNEGRGLVVIAATNRLEDLDEAVLRRFESKVLVNVPDLQDRLALVSNYLRGIDTNLNENEENIIGWSGSEIEALCRDASFGPIRDIMPVLAATTNNTNLDTFVLRPVTNDDFLRSYDSLMGNVQISQNIPT